VSPARARQAIFALAGFDQNLNTVTFDVWLGRSPQARGGQFYHDFDENTLALRIIGLILVSSHLDSNSAREDMPRQNHLHVTRHDEPTSNPARTADRLLFALPTFIAIAFGLIFMVGRFVALLREDFKEAPSNLASILLLVVMIGCVSIIVVLACTGAGLTIGLILKSCFAKRLTLALSRHSRAAAG
jgi:hypothetical protein